MAETSPYSLPFAVFFDGASAGFAAGFATKEEAERDASIRNARAKQLGVIGGEYRIHDGAWRERDGYQGE